MQFWSYYTINVFCIDKVDLNKVKQSKQIQKSLIESQLMKDTPFKIMNLSLSGAIMLLSLAILTFSLHNHQRNNNKLHSFKFQQHRTSLSHHRLNNIEFKTNINKITGVDNLDNLQHKQQSLVGERGNNTQYYKNNLKTPNWYYGSITDSEYRVRLFVAATKNNLTSCPYDKPYVTEADLANCFNCPLDKPLYNLGSSQCEECPEKTQFNQYIGNCTLINANGSASTNQNGKNGSNAQVGGISTILEQQKRKQQEEEAKRLAQEKQKQQAANKQPNTQLQNGTKTSSNQTQSSNNGAVANNTGNTRNPQNSSQQNKNGANGTTNTQNTGNGNTSAEGTTNVQGGDQNKANQTQNVDSSNCPDDKPNFLNGQCRPCPENQEPITYQVTNSNGQVIRKIRCIQKIFATNPDAPKLIQPEWKYLEQKNQDLKSSNPGRIIYTCPVDRPYLISGVCNKCEQDFFFNASSLSCVKQCEPSTIYIERLKMCVNGTFFTSPESQNLIFDLRSQQEYRKQTEKAVKQISYSKYCPKQSPYSIGNKCSSCSENKPYFNIDSQQCQDCQIGRYYDSQQRKCVASYDASVSIDRMVMNII